MKTGREPVPSESFYGASAQDWDNLIAAGAGRDLLPVALDPAAPISARSALRERGKVPSDYHESGIVGIPKWPDVVASPRQINSWRANRRLGVCVITRNVRAIDVDVTDPEEAADIDLFLECFVPGLPRRRRTNSSKFLAAFWLGGVLPKRVIRTRSGGIIELLGTGQQFVAAGIHYSHDAPSGGRYVWDTPDGFAPSEIPALELEAVDELWQALIDKFGDTSAPARPARSPAGTATKPRKAKGTLPDDVADFLHQNGLVTHEDKSGRLDIVCPFEAEHTTQTVGSATSYFPAGVGGFTQGHFRCLHAHCEHRSDDDFLNAIGYIVSHFQSAPPEEAAMSVSLVNSSAPAGQQAPARPLPRYKRMGNGVPAPLLNNVLMALEREEECGARLVFDDFQATILIADEGSSNWRPFDDQDYTLIRSTLEKRRFAALESSLVKEAVKLHCKYHRIDTAIEWASTLQWDGVPRIESAMVRYFGAADTAYSRAVGRYLFTAMAGRCLTPGEKTDMIVVLQGEQGIGKSIGVAALAPTPETYANIAMTTLDADTARILRGRLVAEIDELRGLRTAGREHIKAWVTRTSDTWVAKYNEFTNTLPRRATLIGTTNEDDILSDPTGDRRWLPIHVESVDVAAIKRDRDQLWAEGIALYLTEGVAWEEANRLAGDVREHFKDVDPWMGVIANWLRDAAAADTRGEWALRGVALHEVAEGALHMSIERLTSSVSRRIAGVLRELGYERRRVVVQDANGDMHRVMRWVKAKAKA